MGERTRRLACHCGCLISVPSRDLLRPTRIDVASLVRLSRHPATEPFWSAGVYRFDDPDPDGADAFGTCYTASTIEVAFAESVIHECGRFVRGSYEVPAAELTERSVVP